MLFVSLQNQQANLREVYKDFCNKLKNFSCSCCNIMPKIYKRMSWFCDMRFIYFTFVAKQTDRQAGREMDSHARHGWHAICMTGKLFRTYAKCDCLLKCQVTRKCDDAAFCLNSAQCSIQVQAEQQVRRVERVREGREGERKRFVAQ